ncbi:MAG: phosphate regulon sensor histidine kinase PhoR [Gammaproteobacteria bacterium]|nr:phosphate regulon sensor histidine kinase PhoR [Gammaproteobacteria bacterium]
MEDRWLSEVTLMGLVLALVAFIGWLFDHTTLFLVLGLAAYLGWHLRQLVRLYHWLGHQANGDAPEARGLWGEVYFDIARIKKRYRERRRRLATIVNRFRASTTAMPDATVVLAHDGRIDWFNKAAQSLLGLRPAADMGQRIDNLWRHPKFIEYIKSKDYLNPLEIRSPVNEDLQLSVRIVPYGDDLRLLIVRDISRLYALERMRRDFVANVSHELRTPLTVISGYLETIASAENLPTSQQRAFTTMQQQASRMRRIVEDLLMLSRLENTEVNAHSEKVDVATLLTTISDEARLLSGEQAHAITLHADPQIRMLGNAKELYSAFANLVFNAVHYTPAHGHIDITWQADDQHLVYTVTDTGIGIPAHHIPRLTERFYRVDDGRSRASGGTGLGLAIVKHVLARHNGYLEIESTPGVGSTFRCVFPINRRA